MLFRSMTKAEEILANPGNYTPAQFKTAIAQLQTAYDEANDFATEIETIQKPQVADHNDIYDLSGRKVNGKWGDGKWPRGIYIIGGKKVMVK